MQLRLLVWALLAPLAVNAQFLYNAARDAKGQQAVTQAKEVTNGQVFDQMIENLDRLSKASGDRFFNDAERQMRANLAFFRTWGNIRMFATGLEQRLRVDLPGDATPAQVKDAVARVEVQTKDAQDALKTLQQAAKDRFKAPADLALIGTWFAQLGQLSDLLGFVEKFKQVQNGVPPGFLDAADEAASLAAGLGNMYKDFKVAVARTPDMVVLQTQVQLLMVNEDHLKQMARIIAQRESDLQDTRVLLRQVDTEIRYIIDTAMVNPAEEISKSIADRATAPDTCPRLADRSPNDTSVPCVRAAMLFVLYNAAALAARDTIPNRLASLRLADEERRYSIRESAVAARSYETLISTGVDRLANYYKGGLQPATLAQIATALATLGLIPAVAVK
jgi:hypothetical protein